MVVMSSGLRHLLDRDAVSPEQLARFVRDQQRYISTPFRQLANVSLSFDFNFIQAVWRIDHDSTFQIAQALGTFVEATKSSEAFCRQTFKHDDSLAALHAGLDVGPLLIAPSRAIGEVITSAVAFAEEAIRQGWRVIIPRELYEFIKAKHEKPLPAEILEVKATVRRRREIVPLSLNDAAYLSEWG